MKPPKYMTGESSVLSQGSAERASLYPDGLAGDWKNAKATIEEVRGEKILRILGHEVMSDYQTPYMKVLAEIVTRKSGDILNVGYGLGILDREIETYRDTRGLGRHTIIELNKSIAATAKSESTNYEVINDSWQNAIATMPTASYDGIAYDGYPLSPEEQKRDGITFIDTMMNRGLLRNGGILTFYVDAASEITTEFRDYLMRLGFIRIEVAKVPIVAPERKRQHCSFNHFLAPAAIY